MKQKDSETLKIFRIASMELDNQYAKLAKRSGLAESEYWSMMLIYEGVCSQSAISKELSLSRQTINSAFGKLLKEGLITLKTNGENQRSKYASLTSKGRSLIKKNLNDMHSVESEVWNTFTQSEQEQLSKLTKKFADTLKKLSSSEDMRP